MNILIVTQYFWPESFRINDLALGLKEKGHTITILTGIPNYPGGRFFPNYGIFKKWKDDYHGIKVIRVPIIPRGNSGTIALILNYLSFTLCASFLAPLLCPGKFDLIFFSLSPVAEGVPALVLKKIKAARVLFWVQDLWPESLSATGAIRSRWMLNKVEKLVRFIYRRCDLILVQSRAFISPIEKLGVDSSRIVYFPNSAEELYQPIDIELDAHERTAFPRGFCVLFAGNIGVAQDFPSILEAAARLKEYSDIHWIIIGDGRMEPWVREQVRERDLTKTVHLLGRHPATTMPRYFSLADVLLVSLKKNPIFAYTIPAKIQSYLASAKPIIAALDGEGARIVAEAGAGLTCPAESPRELSEAVLSLYQMPELQRRSMGARGRHYFESHFERAMLVNRLDSLMTDFQVEE
jgi:colanic acid biosynthesis glycosyl transferase WcaI